MTLTTNGILLAEQLDALLDAGIDAINISLDTLDPELFKKVARRDGLEKVFEGIEAALAHPGLSLKINSVPVIKEKENFIGIAGLAQKYPIHVRFIEMMPIGFGKQFPFQDEESIKAVLEEAYGPMHAVNERYGNGPCHYYEIAGFKGKIGFISAMNPQILQSVQPSTSYIRRIHERMPPVSERYRPAGAYARRLHRFGTEKSNLSGDLE